MIWGDTKRIEVPSAIKTKVYELRTPSPHLQNKYTIIGSDKFVFVDTRYPTHHFYSGITDVDTGT